VKSRALRKPIAAAAYVIILAILVVLPSRARADEAAKISGFVDASYSDLPDAEGTFSLDQVEIDIEKKLEDNLSLRADINYLTGMTQSFTNIVEQGFLTYSSDALRGAELTFGKFNAPIGFELLDPVDMYQFSHSLVFDNGLPTNLTGLMGHYAFSEMVDASLYMVNGWDNNADNNTGKTVGGRIGITPAKGVNVGISAITGSVETAGNTADKRTVIDIDATITMIENLTIGAEYNSGTEDKSSNVTSGNDAKWTGYLIMGHYEFNDRYGLTLRYDYFNDKDAIKLANLTPKVKVKQSSITVSPTISLGENAGMLLEYRRDKSSEKVFNDGGTATDSSDSYAVEFTYSF